MKTYVTYDKMSLNSSYNEKSFRQTMCRNSEHTFYFQFFFFENRAVYEITWKNMEGDHG